MRARDLHTWSRCAISQRRHETQPAHARGVARVDHRSTVAGKATQRRVICRWTIDKRKSTVLHRTIKGLTQKFRGLHVTAGRSHADWALEGRDLASSSRVPHCVLARRHHASYNGDACRHLIASSHADTTLLIASSHADTTFPIMTTHAEWRARAELHIN